MNTVEPTSNVTQSYKRYMENYLSSLDNAMCDLGYAKGTFRECMKAMRTASTDRSIQEIGEYAFGFYQGMNQSSNNSRFLNEQKQDGEKYVNIVPLELPNGGLSFVDNVSGQTLSMLKMPNGHYSVRGPEKFITLLGGRGELSTMYNMVADGNYFNGN